MTGSFTATGGENYTMFEGLPLSISETLVSAALIEKFGASDVLVAPGLGRQVDLATEDK